jgi:hypothetical protein
MWAQRLQQSTNFTSQSLIGIIIANQVRVHKTRYFQSLIVQRKISESSNDDTRYHDEARTWHHSALSSLARDASHSTDQARGRVHGQVKLATISSKVSPENKTTSKAEYTNTQQGLPNYWYILSRLLDMQDFWLRGCFCQKASKSESLLPSFSIKF